MGLVVAAVSIVLITVRTSFAQSLPTGDPEADKRTYLQQGNPSINENATCPQTCVGGVLWPTLVQVKNFLVAFTGGIPLVLTGGSETTADHQPGIRSHGNGFKVDLRISSATNTFADPLSGYVTALTGKLFNQAQNSAGMGTYCRGDGAPFYALGGGAITNPDSFPNMIFAMEFPVPSQDPKNLGNGYAGPLPCPLVSPSSISSKSFAPHWDIASGYSGLDVTPDTLTLKVGESMQVTPIAIDGLGNTITKIAWMFDYDFPSDTAQRIASIDPTGAITGTAGSVMGVRVGSSELLVSEGPYYGLVQITVIPPDPPDNRTCDETGPPCWMWDPNSGDGGAWIWNPGQPTTSNPNPPGPPPAPGQCANNSTQNVPPNGCWVWDNNGGGAWIFIVPQGGGGGTTTLPITPVGSLDPNDITGLHGVGTTRFLTNTAPFTYLIQFENLAAATAPAQQVTVTDLLNAANFDLSTVTLGPITFPGQVVTPPAVPLVALGTFSTDVDLRPTTNLIVRLTASLNVQSGVLSWSMASLDPSTLQPPTDPLAGFLPSGSDGSVSLIANAKSSLASGTSVSDQASIVFDLNPAIATPIWSNTIDSTPPVSSVAALPATESSTSFTATWQGADAGSGIQDFTVFASDNGGPFSAWLVNTTATSARFFGQSGHTYAFYSIARDLVGNVEPAKAAAEATTRVVSDTIPPTTTASIMPTPNAPGWNNAPVSVTLTSVDNTGGSGVKQITYAATGAQSISNTTIGSATASFTIGTEGITTITFFGTDNSGNIETANTLTIRLDKTSPSITRTRMPVANSNGWNNSPVTVSFLCADTLSGLAAGSPPAPSVLSTQGAGQSVSGTCADIAGNAASASVQGINIDLTPPILTITAYPPANANGWNNSNVTVSFAAIDTLSSVGDVTAPVTVTAEGAGQSAAGSALDLAGNLASGSIAINLDRTPPEVFNQFDAINNDVLLFGRDSLSGTPPGPIQPISVVSLGRSKDDDGDDMGCPDGVDVKKELRTYRVLDLAGNTVTLIEKVKRSGQLLRAKFISIQYGGGPVTVLPKNRESFDWTLAKDGGLKELDQEFRIAPNWDGSRVEADFDARSNTTTIVKEVPKPKTKVVKPGLDLVRMATAAGQLSIEF
jgi:hypothetical protein